MELLAEVERVRQLTEQICAGLPVEDMVAQVDEDTSPLKWHLAHTTWFFERFILVPHLREHYSEFSSQFNFLFNSYYESEGERANRFQRGTYSRPTLHEVYNYRMHVGEHLKQLAHAEGALSENELVRRLQLGINHEQQHQELMQMDLLATLARNPELPEAAASVTLGLYQQTKNLSDLFTVKAGVYEVGSDRNEFVFDNERPKHKVCLNAFTISNRLITNSEYAEFIQSGGYENPEYWLSDGWTAKNSKGWKAPLYWIKRNGEWYEFSLSGLKRLESSEPVRHVSHYEADAFSQWKNMRLPTEFEWEVSAELQNDREPWRVWQWTSTAYHPYPGFKKAEGAFGEYNAKFMSNQMVLRGGCEFTPQGHYRLTYRNFYQPEKRWSLTGIRLVQS